MRSSESPVVSDTNPFVREPVSVFLSKQYYVRGGLIN
jgi:hypothetical protein